jgi:hypothetical protein
MECFHQDFVGLVSFLDEGFGFGGIRREWFFQEDVFSGLVDVSSNLCFKKVCPPWMAFEAHS